MAPKPIPTLADVLKPARPGGFAPADVEGLASCAVGGEVLFVALDTDDDVGEEAASVSDSSSGMAVEATVEISVGSVCVVERELVGMTSTVPPSASFTPILTVKK